jgi:sulfur carrier protein ThiS
VVVRVTYVFGLSRAAGGRDTMTLDLPPGATVFEALQRLGVSCLELHASVNGQAVPDGTVLRDGDEMLLIPAIQGGAGRSRAMRSTVRVALALVAGLGLAGPAAAQMQIWTPARIPVGRTAAPVIVRPPAPAAGRPAGIATPTVGVGAAAVVGRTPGWGGGLRGRSGASRSVTVTTESSPGTVAGSRESRITVRDTTGIGAVRGFSNPVAGAVGHRKGDQRVRVVEQPSPSGGREVEITVESGRHAPPVEVPLILLVE